MPKILLQLHYLLLRNPRRVFVSEIIMPESSFDINISDAKRTDGLKFRNMTKVKI